MIKYDYIIVGSGFFGSVVAERIAADMNRHVLVIDRRNHIGGNSYSEIDAETGIECHKYGSHIFHTSNKSVWEYISKFAEFTPYQHKVLTRHGNKIYFMPINLKTINDFYGICLSPVEVSAFLKKSIAEENCANPRNLEEKAISLIGRPLYDAFIRGYTMKQWECDPRELPAEIITRLPVRNNFGVNYFNDAYQGVPKAGYFSIFEKLLNHPNIEVRLNTEYRDIQGELPKDSKVIFTGMIDELFDYKFGPLAWRSLRFEWETMPVQDFQGTTVMNFSGLDVPYTRIHEFKHYHPERTAVFDSAKTVICREYSVGYQPGMEAYYPVNNQVNLEKLARYETEVALNPNLIMGGRLGCYKYWDMDKAIENALNCYYSKIKKNEEK